MASNTHAYIVEQNDILQTFTVTSQDDPIFQSVKIAKGFILVSQKGKIYLFGEEGEEGVYAQLQELQLNIEKAKVSQVEFNRKS